MKADDLGSLDIGSPIYYRRINVGQITAYKLSDDGKSVELQTFIRAPYDKFVTTDTRFWQASGIDVTLNASGFNLDTQSLASIVAGGIAFGFLKTQMRLSLLTRAVLIFGTQKLKH